MKVRLKAVRRRDTDRYGLTPLAEALLEDPLATWYKLEPAAESKLDQEDILSLEVAA